MDLKILLIYLFILWLHSPSYTQGPPIFADTPILLGLEGKGVRTFGSNLASETNPYSLFISPGIQYIVSRRVLFETGVQIPIIEEVSIDQETNFAYTSGTRILIF